MPETPTVTYPEVGTIYVHNQSQCFYRVIALLDGGVIVYQRYGDGLSRRLSVQNFYERLRISTDEERARLERSIARIEIQRVPASIAIVDATCQILDTNPSEAMPQAATPPPPRRRPMRPQPMGEDDVAEPGVLIETTDADQFEFLVLHDEAKKAVDSGLRIITQRESLENIWHFSQVQPLSGRCILNFYGSPGTGKTRTARAIARRLGKKLYQVDYSQVISKYYGDTAKGIQKAFKRATEAEAILFFDEADSLLSRRIDMGKDGATSVNQNRNVLMQELDRFTGIVIMSTNLFQNYDEAMLRRIGRHVEFRLPTVEMREDLLKKHIPAQDRCIDINWKALAEYMSGFSGGDILNVAINSMEAASTDENTDNWKLTQEILTSEIQKIKRSKAAHATHKTATKKDTLGFTKSKVSDN